MQLEWKPDSNPTIVIDFDDETTVEQGIRLLLTQKGLSLQAIENGVTALAMWYGATRLENASKLADSVPTSGLPRVELKQRPKAVAPKPLIVERLRVMLETTIQKPRREFLLISIGSYVHGDKEEKEAMRQQCPKQILDHCLKLELPLRIILADEGFSLGGSGGKQIYDFKTLPWIERPSEDHVVHYECEKPPIDVYGYPTNLAEWGKQTERLAGTDLNGLGNALEDSGGLLMVRSFTGDIMFRSPNCPDYGK